MSTDVVKPKLTPAFELFSVSIDKIKKNIGIMLGLYFAPIAFLIAIFAVAFIFFGISAGLGSTGASTIINIISLILGLVFLVGILFSVVAYAAMLQTLYLQLAQGKKATLRGVWEQTSPRITDVFLAGLLAGLIIIGGFILLFIPGLFMIRRYYLISYFVIDKNMGPREALRACGAQSKKASGYIWSLLGVMLLFNLIAFVPFGGLISPVILFLYSIAPAIRYLEIKDLA